MPILSELLRLPLAPPHRSPQDWKARWSVSAGPWGQRALLGGLSSERPAWAFAWGYQAALHRLVPGLVGVAALAVSEGRNTRPKTLQTANLKGRLRGRKSYVFLGELADTVLVLAKQGEKDGRPVLKLYPVTSGMKGVQHTALGPTPFVPEVPHSSLEVDLLCPPPLPGDGWSDYSKPFRILEDLFVLLAMLGHGARACRQAGLDAELEGLLPCILALLALSEMDPTNSEGHRALEGCLVQGLGLLDALAWESAAPGSAERWARDRRLFLLGTPARDLRINRARLREQ
ncbi:MAG: acyl-CoA dehydrogenase [Cognaticolwellia sp.]|jgi:acyl-CoA dehydrogenase